MMTSTREDAAGSRWGVLVYELSDGELVAESNRGLFARVVGFRIEFFERCSSTALRFIDGQGQQIAGFPWWDGVDSDLRTWSLDDIPLDDITQPYTDLDQCWRILIWRHADRVYIAEGDDELMFHGLYLSMAGEYTSAWTEALAQARTMPSCQSSSMAWHTLAAHRDAATHALADDPMAEFSRWRYRRRRDGAEQARELPTDSSYARCPRPLGRLGSPKRPFERLGSASRDHPPPAAHHREPVKASLVRAGRSSRAAPCPPDAADRSAASKSADENCASMRDLRA